MRAACRYFQNGRYAGTARALVQPFLQLSHCGGVATGPDFDAAVRQIDCVAGQIKWRGNIAGADSEKDTLNASGNFE
jgi:hypothetical protein